MSTSFFEGVLSSAALSGTSILYATVGEVISERAGIVNLGLEGVMLMGAVTGFAVTAETRSPYAGLLAASFAGALFNMIFAYLVVTRRGNQLASGLTMMFFALGVSAIIGKPYVGKPIGGLKSIRVPGLAGIPQIGQALFEKNLLVYLAIPTAIAVWFLLYRTRWGLRMRAAGEDKNVAFAAGLKPQRLQYQALFIAGLLGGIGGAHLSIAYTKTWQEGMTAGAGFIAVGLVIFAAWSPIRAILGAVLFGAAVAVQLQLQARGTTVSPFLLDMIPYLAVLIVLILFGRVKGRVVPAGLKDVFAFGLVAAAVLSLSACSGSNDGLSQPAADGHAPFVMGMIHVGSRTDAGYNQAHSDAASIVRKNLPYVRVLEAENIAENADVSRVIETMIAHGAKFIVPASFGYLDPALEAASKHPDVVFDHPAGFKQAENFHTFWASSDQQSYALGIAAGKMTRTNKLGFIGGFQIPNVLDTINAFTLGARSVNPKAEMHVIFDNTWSDPAKEAASTNALADEGADVVTMIVDSPITVVQTAEERGIYSIGFHSTDVQKYAPKGWISGIGFTWGGFLTREIQAVERGSWKSNPKNLLGDLNSDMVALAPWGAAVPVDVRAMVETKIEEFKTGKAQVFAGPIKDNKGNIRIPAGEIGDPSLVNTFDWFVEGVIGQGS